MALTASLEGIMAAVEVLEGDDVVAWRYQSLEGAGYRAGDAARLACARHVDLHLAVDLLQRGCDDTTALRILL
jgi:hypothetical protein